MASRSFQSSVFQVNLLQCILIKCKILHLSSLQCSIFKITGFKSSFYMPFTCVMGLNGVNQDWPKKALWKKQKTMMSRELPCLFKFKTIILYQCSLQNSSWFLRVLKQRMLGAVGITSMCLGPISITLLHLNLQWVWFVFAPVIREIKQLPTFTGGYLGINLGRCSLPLIAWVCTEFGVLFTFCQRAVEWWR